MSCWRRTNCSSRLSAGDPGGCWALAKAHDGQLRKQWWCGVLAIQRFVSTSSMQTAKSLYDDSLASAQPNDCCRRSSGTGSGRGSLRGEESGYKALTAAQAVRSLREATMSPVGAASEPSYSLMVRA